MSCEAKCLLLRAFQLENVKRYRLTFLVVREEVSAHVSRVTLLVIIIMSARSHHSSCQSSQRHLTSNNNNHHHQQQQKDGGKEDYGMYDIVSYDMYRIVPYIPYLETGVWYTIGGGAGGTERRSRRQIDVTSVGLLELVPIRQW